MGGKKAGFLRALETCAVGAVACRRGKRTGARERTPYVTLSPMRRQFPSLMDCAKQKRGEGGA